MWFLCDKVLLSNNFTFSLLRNCRKSVCVVPGGGGGGSDKSWRVNRCRRKGDNKSSTCILERKFSTISVELIAFFFCRKIQSVGLPIPHSYTWEIFFSHSFFIDSRRHLFHVGTRFQISWGEVAFVYLNSLS